MKTAPSEDYAGHFASSKKFSKVVSKKLEFGHLKVKGENDDDDPRTKKFSGGGATLLDFSHVGVRGGWLYAQHELRLCKKNLLRCFQNR
jgi:hypothetical protein